MRTGIVYATLLVVLVATSSLRLVGDGDEFLQMANQLASFHFPRPGANSHFWLYSALAVPGIWTAWLLGASPLMAFAVLNSALLVGAAFVTARRLKWPAVVLLFVGPITWWADKAHSEAFTFALLAIASSTAGDRPWWALVAVGLAATQNPPMALLVPVIAVATIVCRPDLGRDRRFHAGVIAGLALGVLHPAYYLIRLGRWTALGGNIVQHVPNARELLTVLIDPNLGLAPAFPALVLAVALALTFVLLRDRRRLFETGVLLSLAASVILLSAASQVANVNHGGTPTLSRYATWFIPLAIPLLHALDAVAPGSRRSLAPLAIASAAWCVVLYRPAVADGSLTPTKLALWLWTSHPAADNPLPEVFAERLSGNEDGWLPVATTGCEKILTTGRGPGRGSWPLACPPVQPPEECERVNVLCFANRRDEAGSPSVTAYDFVVFRTTAPQAFKLRREAVWTPTAARNVRALIERAGGSAMRPTATEQTGAVVRNVHNAAPFFLMQSPTRALAFFGATAEGATVTLNGPATMRGWLIDGETGAVLQNVEPDRTGQIRPLALPVSAQPLVLLLTTG